MNNVTIEHFSIPFVWCIIDQGPFTVQSTLIWPHLKKRCVIDYTDIEIVGRDTDTSHIRVCLCGNTLLGLPTPLRGKHSPKDNTISYRDPSCNRFTPYYK